MELKSTLLSVVLACSIATTGFAYTKVPNPSLGPDIYVDWDEVIDPVLNSDFLVDFTDPARPDVIFRVGSDTWRVWSENSGDPSALGDLTCPYADNFTIAVMNSSGGVGATSVESIILDPTNDVNYSSLGGANITGNVNGGISLQKSSGGNGGSVTGTTTISGMVNGDIAIPRAAAIFIITGNYSDTATFDVIDGGTVYMSGTLQPGATIRVKGFANSGRATMGAIEGTLMLDDGVPLGCTVTTGAVRSTGIVDMLYADVAGTFDLNDGGTGEIRKVGDISGTFWLDSTVSYLDFEGDLYVNSISGQLYDVSNALHPFKGKINVAQGVSGTIHFLNSAPAPGGGFDGTIAISGDLSGTIETDGELDGAIEILGDMTSSANIRVEGSSSGAIRVDGNMKGNMYFDESSNVSVTLNSNSSGSLVFNDDLDGYVAVSGFMTGDVDIGGDLGGTGNVTVNDGLRSYGRILIGGISYGDITVHDKMSSSSLIAVHGGIGRSCDILISLIDNGVASGDILIGDANPPAAVVYDGSIKITDGNGGGGMSGDIVVTGCHDTGHDLDLCICGTLTGSAAINQSGCPEQVAFYCMTGCP